MIQSVWPYLAVMLLAAGIFPALERRTGWKFFSVFPPIVLVYLSITALAVIGLWQVTPAIKDAQGLLIRQLVPALIFLLMVNCDLRAILALGPRVLAVFACTTLSLFIAFLATFLMFRGALPVPDGWQPLAALSGSWVGGTANLVAVKQAIAMDDNQLALALLAAAGSAWLAALLPTSDMVSATTWTIIIATVAGLVVAHTPLARFPGASRISGALLIFVVAVMASQSNFNGIATAPLYLLCGVVILAIHAGVMLLAAKLFRFDMYLCGISSLAHIGGVAAAPILAATYSAALVPVAVLLALLGYILGTGFGLLMATVFSSLAPVI